MALPHVIRTDDSSVFTRVGYNPNTRELYLEFRNGSRWLYLEFPNQLWLDFLSADSRGVFYNRFIKGWGKTFEITHELHVPFWLAKASNYKANPIPTPDAPHAPPGGGVIEERPFKGAQALLRAIIEPQALTSNNREDLLNLYVDLSDVARKAA